MTSNALAQHLGIRAASVTGMLQKLAAQKPPFVKYEKHHGVRLTATGKMRALEVLRHHRLLERFLHDFLDYSWDEVHDEAERLEHFISEKLEDRIAAKLGDPETDPHGHLIPERSGALPAREEVLLSRWACGVPAVISSVSDRDPAALREMTRLGLKPGRGDHGGNGNAECLSAGPNWRSYGFSAPEPDSCLRNLGDRPSEYASAQRIAHPWISSLRPNSGFAQRDGEGDPRNRGVAF